MHEQRGPRPLDRLALAGPVRAAGLPRDLRWRTAGPIAAAAVSAVFFMTTCFWPALRTLRHGFPTYYVSARLVLERRWTPQVYDDLWYSRQVLALTNGSVGEVFAPNPPSAALVLLPLAWLDLNSARAAWLSLNLALLLATLVLLVRPLPVDAIVWQSAFIAYALSYGPLRENFRLGQVYLLLLLLFSFSLSRLRRRPAGAGLGLGLAAALKLSGGPVWLVLALRRGWRTLAAAMLTVVAVVSLSVGLTGWAGWERFANVLASVAGGPGWASATAFQTIPSYFQHMFVFDPHWNAAPLLAMPWLARAATLAVTALVLAATLALGRKADLDLAFGAALTTGVVLLPLAEEYHYTLLLLPIAVAASRLAAAPRWVGRGETVVLLASLALLAAPWAYKDPWFWTGWHALLAYPRLYGGLLLWAWLAWQMARPGTADAAGARA